MSELLARRGVLQDLRSKAQRPGGLHPESWDTLTASAGSSLRSLSISLLRSFIFPEGPLPLPPRVRFAKNGQRSAGVDRLVPELLGADGHLLHVHRPPTGRTLVAAVSAGSDANTSGANIRSVLDPAHLAVHRVSM